MHTFSYPSKPRRRRTRRPHKKLFKMVSKCPNSFAVCMLNESSCFVDEAHSQGWRYRQVRYCEYSVNSRFRQKAMGRWMGVVLIVGLLEI